MINENQGQPPVTEIPFSPVGSTATEVEEKDALLDWAETLLCNAVPMSHCTQEEWDKMIQKWRDQKHGVPSVSEPKKLEEEKRK